MSDMIAETTPLNLLEEKAKFLADPTYNPQFQYAREFSPTELTAWGLPKESYFQHAHRMLDKHPLPHRKKEYITVEDIQRKITQFNETYKLPQPVEVFFSEKYVSRCRISINKMYFQLPITYSAQTLDDLCRHELETHLFRNINHTKQPWGMQKFPDPMFRRTEEGLAGIHTHLCRDEKLIFKSYRTYIAAYLAQKTSFTHVFQGLLKLGASEPIAWLTAVRTKRGMKDTSQPGGLTKDITYFEGMVAVWQWLMDKQNDPKDLYLGRIDISQVEELRQHAMRDGLLYPSFFDDMKLYHQNVALIGQVNQFETLI